MFEPGACFSGKMRCLAALAQWDELNILCKEFWTPAEPAARLEMAPMVGFILISLVMDVFPCPCSVLMFVRLQMLLGTWENGTKWQNMCLDWMMVTKQNFEVWGTLLPVVMEVVVVLSSGLFYWFVEERYLFASNINFTCF